MVSEYVMKLVTFIYFQTIILHEFIFSSQKTWKIVVYMQDIGVHLICQYT